MGFVCSCHLYILEVFRCYPIFGLHGMRKRDRSLLSDLIRVSLNININKNNYSNCFDYLTLIIEGVILLTIHIKCLFSCKMKRYLKLCTDSFQGVWGNKRLICYWFIAFLFFCFCPLSLREDADAMAQSHPPSLEWLGHGLSIKIEPMSDDLVRAFFIGRGFSARHASYLAKTGCMFRSAIGNAGKTSQAPPVFIDLTRWRIKNETKISSLKTREMWEKNWEKRKIPPTARTAFYWALFPTTTEYYPMDYNWGMLSFNLSSGTKFDLEVYWEINGNIRKHIFQNLVCGA